MSYTQLAFKKEKFVKISSRLSVIDGYNRQSISERTVLSKSAFLQKKKDQYQILGHGKSDPKKEAKGMWCASKYFQKLCLILTFLFEFDKLLLKSSTTEFTTLERSIFVIFALDKEASSLSI